MKSGIEVRAQESRASSVSMQEEMTLTSFLWVKEENTLEAKGQRALGWESSLKTWLPVLVSPPT